MTGKRATAPTHPMGSHRPNRDEWSVVGYGDDVVTVYTPCVCGDDDCGYVSSTYSSQWVHSRS